MHTLVKQPSKLGAKNSTAVYGGSFLFRYDAIPRRRKDARPLGPRKIFTTPSTTMGWCH